MKRTLKALSLLALTGLLGACDSGIDSERRTTNLESALCETGSLSQPLNSTGKVPDGCIKIEGGQIGELPQTLEFSGITVTITSWTNKDGEGDQVGFTFETTDLVTYAVKAGTRTFVSSDQEGWEHPDGTSGPSANGISNITFCPGDLADGGLEEGGECGGGDGSDGGLNENGGGGGDADGGAATDPDGGFTENGGGGGTGTDAGTPTDPDAGFDENGGGTGGAIDAGSPEIN